MTAPPPRPPCRRCGQALRTPPPADALAAARAALARAAGAAGGWTAAEAARWRLAMAGVAEAGKGRPCVFCAHLAVAFAREVAAALTKRN